MSSLGVRFLGHNIPRTVRAGSSTMCAFRIENTLDRSLHFQSHATFYAPLINDTRFHLSVRLNGVFVKPVLVEDDCLAPGQQATLYFAFHAGDAGRYRMQVVMAERRFSSVADDEQMLFETDLRITKGRRFDLSRTIQRGRFTRKYTDTPIREKTQQLSAARQAMASCQDDADRRKDAIAQYKRINKELAFMEKQVRRTQVASLPCYVAIDTTSKCNLECKMCFRSHLDIDHNALPDMPAELVDRLITELFPAAITLNLSTIGEPLMSPYMDKILDACVEYQVYLSMTTNGTLIRGDAFVKKLASVLHHLEISVDSAEPGRFRAYRSGASYEKVLQNASKLGAIRRGLLDPKFNLGFSMTLFRDNLEEVPEMLRIIADLGGNFLKADIGVVFSKKDAPDSVLNCPERYNEMYGIAQEQARAAGMKLMMRPPFTDNEQAKTVKYGICDFLYVSACMRTEGTLSPCYFGPALLGVKESFAEAWNSDVMQRLRTDHDTVRGHDLCRSCYVFTDGADTVEHRRKLFFKGDAL
jgi:MoaA/NifB/PqqE/SkfB family radical SAM enzyme